MYINKEQRWAGVGWADVESVRVGTSGVEWDVVEWIEDVVGDFWKCPF